MAIAIVKSLAASPNPTTLPRRIEFTQTLRGDRDGEPITVVYRLGNAVDVWFEEPPGQRTKTVARTETVGRQDKVCVDRLRMVEGPAGGAVVDVEVGQTITDADGRRIPDLTIVVIR